MTPLARGRLLVVAAAVFWSFSGVGVKCLPQLDPLVFTGWRSLFALPLLLAALWWEAGSPRSAGAMISDGLRRPATWGSGLAYAGMLMLFITATWMTTAANAILLQYTAPLWVALLAWPMLGEPVRGREWAALAGCLAGMAMFFGDRVSADGRTGNILAVLSGICCGLNALFLRKLSRAQELDQAPPPEPPGGVGPLASSHAVPLLEPTSASPEFVPPLEPPDAAGATGLAASLPAVILGNLLVIVFSSPWMIPGTPADPRVWLVLAALGLLQLGLPYVLFSLGIRLVSAVEGILLATLEAILNPVWTAIGVGELPSPIALLGGVVILVSVTAYGLTHQGTESETT